MMGIHAHVVVLAGDQTLVETTASTFADEGCRVSTDLISVLDGAQLIVRDWRDERWLADPGVPVVTVDLTLIQGQDLVDVTKRVFGFRHGVGS